MVPKQPALDDIVKIRCTRCRGIKNHTIVGFLKEQAQVKCSSCQEIRVHRGEKATKGKTKPSGSKKKAASSGIARAGQIAAERQEWEILRPGMHLEKALDYHMTGTYRAKDLLQHPTFGLGLVTRITGPHKIEVLFEQGKKILCCH